MEREDRLNQVLVHLFNDALRIEERSLAGCAPMLSLREVHVIEALCAAGENNTMSALAARLHVTVGSLTVAVSTLARKGYCRRERDTADRRHGAHRAHGAGAGAERSAYGVSPRDGGGDSAKPAALAAGKPAGRARLRIAIF